MKHRRIPPCWLTAAVVLVMGCSVRALAQGPDILIENFEGTNYGTWTVTGTAFGSAPAHGALPGQMSVEGFQGNGLANSFNGGDGSTGKLTSVPFKIQRKYLQFLIGGGGWEGKTCMNLLAGGKVVRSATGPNTNSGGSERLQPGQWDISEFLGQEVTLEIVDAATGGWGHINVDQIVQSDQRNAAPVLHSDATRTLEITKPYLNFPVKNGAVKRRVTVSSPGKEERSFDIELADGKPDWWAFLDATPFQGRTISIKVNKLFEDSNGLNSIDQTDEIKDAQNLYHESLRPQFHFTSRRGWLNDPNGLVFYQGEYHLFYQHNPYGWDWGNMSWGHAVSKDLVHWQELPVALYPDERGTMFSGLAVVDWNNTAGFQAGASPALVAMVTAAGNPFSQEIAYSNDRGRSWVKYEQNPVLKHITAENRDPKVVWYAPEKKWVMALYLDGNDYALFSSVDLKKWQKLSVFHLPGDSECPNFFEVPLDGDRHNTRWVFFGASGVYQAGKFDGRIFTPETPPQHLHHGNCWYAAQVFSDIPTNDGRCLLIPWGRLPDGEIFRGMTFNQMMGLPVELSLRSSPAGPVLAVQPVGELAKLRGPVHDIKPQPVTATNLLNGITGDLLEIEAEIAVGDARTITFDLRGVPVVCEASQRTLVCLGQRSNLVLKNGNLSLHMFIDRRSVDILGDDGRLYMPMASAISPQNQNLSLTSSGGTARILALKVYELQSAW